MLVLVTDFWSLDWWGRFVASSTLQNNKLHLASRWRHGSVIWKCRCCLVSRFECKFTCQNEETATAEEASQEWIEWKCPDQKHVHKLHVKQISVLMAMRMTNYKRNIKVLDTLLIADCQIFGIHYETDHSEWQIQRSPSNSVGKLSLNGLANTLGV